MKINAKEGFGLKLLLYIARSEQEQGLTINQITEQDSMSQHNVAKMLRELRMAGFIVSSRGKNGGYRLAQPAEDTLISDVLYALGGPLFDETADEAVSEDERFCTGSVDCSLRSLWRALQLSIDSVLNDLSLADLISESDEFKEKIYGKLGMIAQAESRLNVG